MVFMLICYFGIAFVAVAIALMLSRRHTNGDDVYTSAAPPQVEPEIPYWHKDPSISPLPRDDLEHLEMWARHDADPKSFPAPIPPARSFSREDC